MSRGHLRAPPAPIDGGDDFVSGAADQRFNSGGGDPSRVPLHIVPTPLPPAFAVPTPVPLPTSTTEFTKAPEPFAEFATTQVASRGERYRYYPVSVVGFPDEIANDDIQGFLRRFGPVAGPGGVQIGIQPWGREAVLIFQSQHDATTAIGTLETVDVMDVPDAFGGPDRVVPLPKRLNAAITNRAPRAAPTSAPVAPTPSIVPPYNSTAWPGYAPPRMPVLMPIAHPYPPYPHFSPPGMFAYPQPPPAGIFFQPMP